MLDLSVAIESFDCAFEFLQRIPGRRTYALQTFPALCCRTATAPRENIVFANVPAAAPQSKDRRARYGQGAGGRSRGARLKMSAWVKGQSTSR
jgi:hypothetical protein